MEHTQLRDKALVKIGELTVAQSLACQSIENYLIAELSDNWDDEFELESWPIIHEGHYDKSLNEHERAKCIFIGEDGLYVGGSTGKSYRTSHLGVRTMEGIMTAYESSLGNI